MDKFINFVDYLSREQKNDFVISLKEIEDIIECSLPNSAYQYNAYWSDDGVHRLAVLIGKCGFKVSPDLKNKRIRLFRIGTPHISSRPSNQKPHKKSNKHLMEITNDNLNKVHELVLQDPKYGSENNVITESLKMYPKNDNVTLVAMKIALIDITNSTHISQHKQKVSLVDLAEVIVSIPNVDERIKSGDPTVVNDIARTNGEINLFSFASKYCCYHNHNLYGKDDFAILDTVLMNTLPLYFDDITKNQIERWRSTIDYKSYNDYITKKLDELGITTKDRKRKFDHFVWYLNR